MYADDVKIYREVRTDADAVLLYDDLTRLVEWSSSWRLKLNASKCKSFTITLKRSPIISPYRIGGVTLDRVTTMRDLGVTLDQKLTFERHVDSIVAAGNRALGLLIRSLQAGARIRYDTGAITSAYFANVRSVLENCSVVWGGAARTHTDRIERIQHKFLIWLTVNSVTNSDSLSYENLLSAHSFTSLAARRVQHDLVYVARLFKHKIDSSSLRSHFGLAVPPRSVRRRDLLAVPFARVETIKNGLYCRVPRLANEFLRENNQLDLFTDSLATVRKTAKSYAAQLSSRAFPTDQ